MDTINNFRGFDPISRTVTLEKVYPPRYVPLVANEPDELAPLWPMDCPMPTYLPGSRSLILAHLKASDFSLRLLFPLCP
jgi:hypothetical protein